MSIGSSQQGNRPQTKWFELVHLFIPSFFAGNFFISKEMLLLLGGFVTFCCFASSIYIINDYQDIEDDRKHHTAVDIEASRSFPVPFIFAVDLKPE